MSRRRSKKKRPHPSSKPSQQVVRPFYQRNWFLAGIVCLISLGVYLLTLAPTVTSEDSGEFIAAAYHWGIPHPPGYPLWTILCGIFIRVVPISNIAFRANLFSAVCTSLSVVPLFLALQTLGIKRIAAMAACFVWAFSGTLWSQSVITEVYGLNALLCSLLLCSAIQWYHTLRGKWLILAGVFFGLGMSNHHTIAFVGAASGAWILVRAPALLKNWKALCIALAGFAAGLLPYAYLPIRAKADPPMNWGNPSNLQRFWNHVTREQYGPTAPLRVEEPRSVKRFGEQARYVCGVLGRDLTTPVAILAVLGLVMLICRRPAVGFLVVLLLCFSGLAFILISNIDLDRTSRFAMKVFFIPLSLALAVSLAAIMHECTSWLSKKVRHGGWIASVGVLAVPLLPAISNFDRCNYSNYWYAYDHASNLLASMMPNAILFPSGDHTTFPLMYLTMVEGERPDVTIADKYGYIDRAVLQEVARKASQSVRLTDEPEKVRFIVRHSRRPVYYATRVKSPVEKATNVPVGVMYHLLPASKTLDELDRDEPWRHIRYRNLETPTAGDLGSGHILFDYHFFKALNELRKGNRDQAISDFKTATKYGWGIKEAFNNVGSALAENGFASEAIEYFEEARRLDKYYLMPRRNLSRIYENLQRWPESEAVLREMIDLSPDDPQPYARLGFLAQRRGDTALARHWWQQSLLRKPDQPEIIRQLD